jgi:hypothetical protein
MARSYGEAGHNGTASQYALAYLAGTNESLRRETRVLDRAVETVYPVFLRTDRLRGFSDRLREGRATLSLMVPRYIRSSADFDQVVKIGTSTETLVLEFKSEVNTKSPLKAETQQESCRDIAQLANTGGGCLLVGVEEQLDPVTNLKRAIGIKPVAKPDDLIQWLEQAIGNWLVPSTFSKEIVQVSLPGGVVLAVNVFPSPHTVYLWDRQRHTIEVLRRTNYGKDWMNPDEVERHIMDGSRAAKIRIEEVVAASPNGLVELVGGMFGWGMVPGEPYRVEPDSPIQVGSIGLMAFEIRIPIDMKNIALQIPYEALKAAWLGPSGHIMLMLDVRVVWNGRNLTLIPYEA